MLPFTLHMWECKPDSHVLVSGYCGCCDRYASSMHWWGEPWTSWCSWRRRCRLYNTVNLPKNTSVARICTHQTWWLTPGFLQLLRLLLQERTGSTHTRLKWYLGLLWRILSKKISWRLSPCPNPDSSHLLPLLDLRSSHYSSASWLGRRMCQWKTRSSYRWGFALRLNHSRFPRNLVQVPLRREDRLKVPQEIRRTSFECAAVSVAFFEGPKRCYPQFRTASGTGWS